MICDQCSKKERICVNILRDIQIVPREVFVDLSGDLVGIVASLFVIQNTYTLPAFFVIAETRLRCQSSWMKAAKKHRFNSIHIVAALVATVLGTYSSILGMVQRHDTSYF